MKHTLAVLALTLWTQTHLVPAAWAQKPACGPFPSLGAKTQAGWCADIVSTPSLGFRMPRTVLWLGRQNGADQLLVVDMGSWEPKRGRLLAVTVDTAKGTASAKELLAGLDRPHGLRLGPDGRIYLGEASRISRFTKPQDGSAVSLEPVVTDLPLQGRHPLKEFVFGADKALYINVGAATDRCEKQASTGADGAPTCPEMTGAKPQAAVYVARFDWPQGKLVSVAPFATGLRNSMALVAHPGGAVFQAENNIDFPDESFPAEELNKLSTGAHYGWPGCVENRKPIKGFAAAACAKTTAPVALLPAHAAPLHMQFSQTAFVSGQVPNSTGLLMSWHGYRASGQRLVRYNTQVDGSPVGPPVELLHDPQAADNPSRKPGGPVGWAEDDRGHLWIADDRNRWLVWLHRETK
jgi:glucose/arabinose dehydrogenase